MPFLVAVPFVVVISGLVVIGLAAMAQSQSSAYTSWLRDNLGVLGATLALGLEATLALSRWVTRKLGEHFEGIERLTVGWIGGLYQYVERVGAMALLWPLELFKVTYWLVWHEIPRAVKALPTAAGTVIHQVTTRVVRIERTVVRLPKLTRKQATSLIAAAVATYIAPYLSMLRWFKAHFHALTAVLPHTLPIPFGRTIAAIRARLRRLERSLPAAVGVAAVIAALGRLKLGFLRCGNFRKAGKQVCGMDSRLLDLLLLDTVAIFSVLSVVTFANELRAVEGEAVNLMGRLVKEWPSPPNRA